MSNPRSTAAGDLQTQIQRLYSSQGQFDVNPMSLDDMNESSRRLLVGDRNRALTQTGSLASGRAASLGLNNPFSFAQRAEGQVFNQYAGALQGIGGSNIDRAFNQLFQSKNAKFGRLAQLLGLQQGNIGNLSSGAWNETVGPLLGAGIGAGGAVLGGYYAGKK